VNTPPVLPVGISTRVAHIVVAITAAISAVTTVLNGDHSTETITFAILSVGTAAVWIGGRQLQAALTNLGYFRDAPVVSNVGASGPEAGEVDGAK
jgi:hypothetical protein